MADFALGSVEKIIKAAMAIKKAVQTVRQNEVECREIEELAATIMDMLLLLQNTAAMNHPAMNRALDGLERTLNYALKLVTVCQGRNFACRLLRSGDMSRKLRRIKDDILHNTVLGTFATTVRVTMTLTNNIRYGGGQHLLTQPENAGKMDISYNSHLATEGSRFGVNNAITMAATGSEVHSAFSTKFDLPELEDVFTHHFPGTDIIRGGGHSLVLRQEIVIIVQMTCDDKNLCKAMKLVAAMGGVESVMLAGYGRDLLWVVGYGLDSIKLTTTLRKNVGPAELLLVGDADAATDAVATTVASARASKRNRIPPSAVFDFSGPPASNGPVALGHELVRPMTMKHELCNGPVVFVFIFLLLFFLRAVSFKSKLEQ